MYALESSPNAETNGLNRDSEYQEERSHGRTNGDLDNSIPILNGDDSIEIVHHEIPIDPVLKADSTVLEAVGVNVNKDKQKRTSDAIASGAQGQGIEPDFKPLRKAQRKPGKKAKDTPGKSPEDNTLAEISPAQNADRAPRGKRKVNSLLLSDDGAETNAGAQDEAQLDLENESHHDSGEQDVHLGQESTPPRSQSPKMKRRRPPKTTQQRQPPAKRPKTSKLPPTNRNPDAGVQVADTEEHGDMSAREDSLHDSPYKPTPPRETSSAPSVAASTAPRLKRPGPRSLTLLRQGTPVEEDGGRITRSGRTSVKPFKWWLNEGYEYHKGQITGVTRAEEFEQSTRKASTARNPGRRKPARLQSIDEDEETEDRDGIEENVDIREEEEELEEWENDTGIFRALVRKYDSHMEIGTRQEEEIGMYEPDSHSASVMTWLSLHRRSHHEYSKKLTLLALETQTADNL